MGVSMSYSNAHNDPTFNQVFATYYDECWNDTLWDVRASGTGSDCKAIGIDSSHPGVIELITGTDTGGKASANFTNRSGSNAGNFVFGGNYTYKAYIDIPVLATGGDDYDLYIGQTDGWVFGTPFDGAYLRYDRATSLNWLTVTVNTGVATSTDSGVAVTTGWHTVMIVGTASGATFYVDGVSLGTNTTHLPTATLNLNSFLVFKTAGTTSRTFYQDYFFYMQQVSR